MGKLLNKVSNGLKKIKSHHVLFTLVVVALVVALIYKFVVKREGFDLPKDKHSIVYANWKDCGHCKKFNPVWDDFVSKRNAKEPHYKKYEQNEQPEFMKKYKITGFPTILAINKKGDKIKEYKGDRSLQSLNEFADSIIGQTE